MMVAHNIAFEVVDDSVSSYQDNFTFEIADSSISNYQDDFVKKDVQIPEKSQFNLLTILFQSAKILSMETQDWQAIILLSHPELSKYVEQEISHSNNSLGYWVDFVKTTASQCIKISQADPMSWKYFF